MKRLLGKGTPKHLRRRQRKLAAQEDRAIDKLTDDWIRKAQAIKSRGAKSKRRSSKATAAGAPGLNRLHTEFRCVIAVVR